MPKRNGLLAGVALPLMSLSLLAEPALSQMRMPQAPVIPELPLVRVQAQILPPPGGQPGAEPEQPPAEQRAEPPAETAPTAPPAEAPPEPEPQAAPEPPREAAPPAPAAPQPESEAVKPPAEEPARDAPAAPPAEAPVPETTAPPAEQPKAEEPAPADAERTDPAPAAPAPDVAPDATTPAPQAQPPAPADQPSTDQPSGDQPSPGQPAAPPAEATPSPQENTAPAGTAPAEGAAPSGPPADGSAVGSPPAAGAPGADGATAPAAPGAAPDAAAAPPPPGAAPAAPEVASPTTPEEIERARRIAQDPASSDQPVVLPVENGAAVLDSAKETPAAQPEGTGTPPAPGTGPRERRDGPRGNPQQGEIPPASPEAPPGAQPAAPPAPAPTSDAEAQAPLSGQAARPLRIEPATAERGERLRERPRYERQRGFEEQREERDGRVIISLDNRTIVRHDDSRRFYEEGYRPQYEQLRGERTREVIERDNGVRIVTIRNRYGDIVQRSRIGRDGREYVLYYAPELTDQRRDPDYVWRDPGIDLPPMRLTVPVDQYIIDTSTEPDRDYYEFLEQPPVERVERVYSLDEVRYSARIRDKVRRIDLDTITFATGSAEIPMTQARSLRKVAEAMKAVLDKDPSETFLIEGHTDAVGSDDSNLVLSDRRAESVAVTLTEVFGIPPENLATQGYGERYLKVRTEGPSQDNRRVTIRRITPLVKPVAQNR
ncbi:OmpA family protein [Rhizobium sp. SL86]|uniref:OmpA family protein n=1 Tax=Rhizobium sp. SL86 TaxID=2995148 RepID=UPI002274AA65|nr:OmpA family protein [Rhizobium sp. SL86]MCY1668904.1 OmpA family protein [Rhizobium sp. SL86]